MTPIHKENVNPDKRTLLNCGDTLIPHQIQLQRRFRKMCISIPSCPYPNIAGAKDNRQSLFLRLLDAEKVFYKIWCCSKLREWWLIRKKISYER